MGNNFDKELGGMNTDYYSVGSFLFEIVKIFALALLIIIPIRVFLFQPFFVQGPSMEPNFENGEYLIINELGYKKTSVGFGDKTLFTVRPFKDLERGDIVVFRYPNNPSQFFIKRIIALPGEEIKVKGGVVTIYNQENPEGIVLQEEYLREGMVTSGEIERQLEKVEYFVMGDNREKSSDSRVWGAVSEEHMIGKVLLRAFPFSRIKVYLREEEYTS